MHQPQPTLIPTHYLPPPPQNRPRPQQGEWPIPHFRLRVEDLSHPGAQLFFEQVNPLQSLHNAVVEVFKDLYTPDTVPQEVETVVLVLRSMPGVAHTTGAEIYKEIHFSLEYLQQQRSSSRARDEINGVLVHEMVHCFQYNGKRKCPGGLIEGIADWVRLQADLRPPHWREGRGRTWDEGYEATAFLLDWIESKYGQGIVRNLNLTMRDRQYDDEIFREQTGRSITTLWKEYREYIDRVPKA
ncbi:plant basic secretory protein [Cristinia sonorae]|uniref:Plant basic secretory protein n=1 Tax=Cristinia sonorae TaxID=1940300 RepID=A0A8K0UKN9_9AGAR|nr:plant basic secretory protein [Cristinia sonorae]